MTSTAESWHPAQEGFFGQPSDWLLDCAFAEENAAGFALGALTVEEQTRFAYHLSWCPSCARLLHEERKTIGYLPFLSPQATPPETAKLVLFDRIHADQQLKGTRLETSTPLLMGGTSTIDLLRNPLGHTVASDMAPSKPPAGRRRFTWEMAVAPLAAVPLVFALAIVGGWALHTQNRLDDRTAQAQVLEDQNAQLAAQIALLSNGLETSQQRTFALDSGDLDAGDNAGGNLLAIANQTWANLSVWNLPQNSGGYEVLVETQSGELQPAGSFYVDAQGKASVQLTISSPLVQYQAVHVLPRSQTARSTVNDVDEQQDVLWTDLENNLGAQSGTEANAKSQ